MNDHYKETYKQFYPDLLKSLPMTDQCFYVELEKKSLFSGNLSEEVKAKDTPAEKAAHFLQNVVSCSLEIGDTEPFANLLEVMENFDDENCSSLAKKIKKQLSKKQTPDPQTTTIIQSDLNTTVEQYKEIYGRFYAKLVQVLPLTDAHFRAALVSKQMFHGDLLCQVDAKETNAEKNEHFLTNTIDCSLNIGIISPFITLLQVMENFGSTTLNKLAENIKTELMISTSGLTHDPLQSLIYTRAIEKAQKRLYAYYTNKQFIRPEHDWPPYHFKYFTPLSIIYENICTGPGRVANTPDNYNKTTEDIKSLFSTYRGCQSYKILIEGEPGIGKTILSSEIAAQWADKALLDDKALLFLLFMRQPKTKNISNIRSLVKHFFEDDMSLVTEITEWLNNTNGKHLAILLDGYDEASIATYSDFFDFINEIISHQRLPECGLVITSRPAESLHLHGRVNCRAEVLGFTKQSREDFIKSYITKQEKEKQIYQTNKQDIIEHNIKKKIKIIEKVLKQNPIMNTLCYIPLNATMLLLCLTESEEEIDLPTTVTTLYERFIIITIKRFLRTKPGITYTILGIDNLPGEYKQTFVQLSKFAYSASIDIGGKKSMQLVFELADIESNCENFMSHGNGLGLLKPASFLNIDIQKKYVSYNFLHKSIQEYMAAYHIASLLSGSATLSNLLNKRFWDSSYFNIWIMYVGITGGEDKEFKHFLSGSRFKLFTPNPSKISDRILGDKIKCLYLLRCAAEAQESRFLLSVHYIFAKKVIDLSNKALSEVDIKTLAVLLLDLSDGPWSLILSGCNINNKCCKVLFETFTSQTVTTDIKTVDISFNKISSENLYRLCHEIFKSWKTDEVVLPIDALYNSVTMKKIEHFTDALEGIIQIHQNSLGKLMMSYQANQTRIICVYSDLKYVKCFQLSDCELNEDVAIRIVLEKLKNRRIGRIYFSHSNIYKDCDKILSYIMKNFQKVKFCGVNMHSKGAYLLDDTSGVNFQIENNPSTCLVDFLAAVLQNDVEVNTSSSYLPILLEEVKERTEETLKNISTIKVLDLTNNNISDCVASDIELILS